MGEWKTAVQRGRVVWTNGGSALHLTRAGGFLFLPGGSREPGAAALLLEDGWVRPIPSAEALARLMGG